MSTLTDMTIDPLSEIPTWRDAVCHVVDEKLKAFTPFSSGEITKEIRTRRPDLQFSHWDVGEFVRDLYYGGMLKYVNDDGVETFALQTTRETNGSSRTPSGSTVYVYSFSLEEGYNHDFEVEIPRPKVDMSKPYDEYGSLDGEDSRRSERGAMHAKVHADKRLCIPRVAFEEYTKKTGKQLNFGDKVHISLDEAINKVKVRFTPENNSKEYGLTKDCGRVKYLPDMDTEWICGDIFNIDINNEGIDILLQEKVLS